MPITEKKPLIKQVYEGKPTELPDWLAEADQAKYLELLTEKSVCKYALRAELKKIMSTRKKFDGSLETEYDGIAGDCGALKNFGKAVAQRDGYLQPYRYVDFNHIVRCCCQQPRRCVFFLTAEGEASDIQARQRRG